MLVMTLSASAQVAAPIEVVNSAIAAMNDRGRQVVLGKLKTSLDRMYPQWKDRLSRRMGGDAALEKQWIDFFDTVQPKTRGTVVPEEDYDAIMKLLGEFRAGPPAPAAP